MVAYGSRRGLMTRPERTGIAEPHKTRVDNVKLALAALPTSFTSGTPIEGFQATDILNANAIFGTTNEAEVVADLNNMRSIWDPDDQWSKYAFVRRRLFRMGTPTTLARFAHHRRV